MRSNPWKGRLLAGLIGAFGAGDAAAKVVFTGYADFRSTPQSDLKLTASDAMLTFLRSPKRRSESRTFSMDSLGLFAATSFNEQADFLIDVTYKKIGATAQETRLQYAYLHLHAPSLWEANVGRVMLPIGYYNRNHFYPFQRRSVTPPFYQSAIIGLPISDHGAIVFKTWDAGPVGFYASGYVVNGYGPTKSSTDPTRPSSTTFRAAVNSSDALLIANNLRDLDANNKPSYGGNARVMFFDKGLKLGVSSYHGPWSTDGKSDFTMLNAYLAAETRRAGVLAEFLRTDTDNDQGVVGAFGSGDWTSSGAFMEASFFLIKEEARSLALFVGTEETVAKGKGSGARNRERMINHKAGAAWKLNSAIVFKCQLGDLFYQVPIQILPSGVVEDVRIRQRSALLSLVLTY